MAFRSGGAAAAWERRQPRAAEPDAFVPVEVLGRLSAPWYAGRFDDGWRPASVAAKQILLDEAGLRGPFWRLA